MTEVNKDITCEMVRERWPEPMKADDYDSEFEAGKGIEKCYCVGGAFLREYYVNAGKDYSRYTFPHAYTILPALQDINPALAYQKALGFAQAITRKNDAGHFEGAWQALCDALAYTGDEPNG